MEFQKKGRKEQKEQENMMWQRQLIETKDGWRRETKTGLLVFCISY